MGPESGSSALILLFLHALRGITQRARLPRLCRIGVTGQVTEARAVSVSGEMASPVTRPAHPGSEHQLRFGGATLERLGSAQLTLRCGRDGRQSTTQTWQRWQSRTTRNGSAVVLLRPVPSRGLWNLKLLAGLRESHIGDPVPPRHLLRRLRPHLCVEPLAIVVGDHVGAARRCGGDLRTATSVQRDSQFRQSPRAGRQVLPHLWHA